MKKPTRKQSKRKAQSDRESRLYDPYLDGYSERQETRGSVLPCEGFPLVAMTCSCRSAASQRLNAVELGPCPLGRPWACPLR